MTCAGAIDGAARQRAVARRRHAPERRRPAGIGPRRPRLDRSMAEALQRHRDALARPLGLVEDHHRHRVLVLPDAVLRLDTTRAAHRCGGLRRGGGDRRSTPHGDLLAHLGLGHRDADLGGGAGGDLALFSAGSNPCASERTRYAPGGRPRSDAWPAASETAARAPCSGAPARVAVIVVPGSASPVAHSEVHRSGRRGRDHRAEQLRAGPRRRPSRRPWPRDPARPRPRRCGKRRRPSAARGRGSGTPWTRAAAPSRPRSPGAPSGPGP